MSGDNHTMMLRPRRSVLGDISNRASIGGNENAANKSIKKNKRLVINDHGFSLFKINFVSETNSNQFTSLHI